ncbi:hypothetical protein TanjilG_29349 [Lupinus angustifolius]|uniref:Uncharacterized protein n=1 Tax=Lupinus angustifolius TaxID=3871 RepID=A0A1J7GSH8_LUPAN|nr:hypothetical protein TanjilG_29349 [Lupinus angustifolius]
MFPFVLIALSKGNHSRMKPILAKGCMVTLYYSVFVSEDIPNSSFLPFFLIDDYGGTLRENESGMVVRDESRIKVGNTYCHGGLRQRWDAVA